MLVPGGALGAGKGRLVVGRVPLRGMNVVLYAATPGAAKPAVLGRARSRRGGRYTLRYRSARSGAVKYMLATRPGGAAEAGYPVPGTSYRLAAAIGAGRVPSRVTLDERTTVAMGYAMAQFIDRGRVAGMDPGLRNAAAMTGNLVRVGSGGLSRVIGTFPNGKSTSTLRAFDSLANLLGACRVQGRRCASLLRQAGAPGGGSAADTLSAIVDLARYPWHNTRGALQALAARQGPFQARPVPRRQARCLDPGPALRRRASARPRRPRQLRDRRRRRDLGRQQLRIQPRFDEIGLLRPFPVPLHAHRPVLPGLAVRKRRHQRGRLRDNDRPERTRLGRQLRLRRQGLQEGSRRTTASPSDLPSGKAISPGLEKTGLARNEDGEVVEDLQGRLGSRRDRLAAGDGLRPEGEHLGRQLRQRQRQQADPAPGSRPRSLPPPSTSIKPGSPPGAKSASNGPSAPRSTRRAKSTSPATSSNSLARLSPGGKVLSLVSGGGLHLPMGAAVDENGYVWVSNSKWVVAPAPARGARRKSSPKRKRAAATSP